MNEYKLSHVNRFDRISVRLKDEDLLRGVVRGYFYNDSDDKGVYVYASLSIEGLRELEDDLYSVGQPPLPEPVAAEIFAKHTCPYFFPWSEVVYLQLG